MKASIIKSELSKAIKYSGKCYSACGRIASEFQPYFDDEIIVFEQPGEGFVIEFEANDGLAPHNIPVMKALAAIKSDPNYYR